MVVGSYSKVLDSSVPPARLWKASSDTHKLVPKLMPNHVSHGELLEGNGGAGTVVRLKFGEALKDLKYVKNRLEFVDNENYVVKFRVLEGGDMGTLLQSCVFELKMEGTSEGGTKTTLKMDYDTIGDTPLSQEHADYVVSGVLSQTKAIEAHLQANRTAYA